jgi:hypothetical protein
VLNVNKTQKIMCSLNVKNTDAVAIRKNIRMKCGTLWIRNMDHRKNRPEKTIGLRDLMLEAIAQDQMDG